MKIIYLTNSRLPTEKAHGVQVMNMVEAFTKAGAEIELVIPDRKNPIKQDMFLYYGKKSVPVKKLWCWDLVGHAPWLGPISFFIESFTLAWSVRNYLRKQPPETVVYTRDLWPLIFVPRRHALIYEVHSLPRRFSFIHRRCLRRMAKMVTITNGLKKHLVALGFRAETIAVAPDAVDLNLFGERSNQAECRAKLNMPPDKKIVVYTGHLYAWKGVDTLLAVAKKLYDVFFVFVGGTKIDAKNFRTKAENFDNILITGHVSQSRVPDYLGAADILVLPNSALAKISAEYTSPLKLFEYMAANRPIVASSLPSLREILTDEIATFFTPDDADSLAASIREVLENKIVAAAKAERAKKEVEKYTWDKRAEAILNFIAYVRH